MSFIIVKYALSSGVFLVTPQEYSITPYPDSERLTFRKAASLFIGHYYNYGVDSKGDFKSNDYFENTPEGRNKAFAYINHLELKKINSIRKQFTQALPAGLSLKAADEARDFISSLQD